MTADPLRAAVADWRTRHPNQPMTLRDAGAIAHQVYGPAWDDKLSRILAAECSRLHGLVEALTAQNRRLETANRELAQLARRTTTRTDHPPVRTKPVLDAQQP